MASSTAKGSIAGRAVTGAAWTILTGIGSRALGLVGTVVLTYYLARDVLGEVSDAAVVTIVASQVATLGVGQYIIANPQAGRAVAWHATVIHQVIGWMAIGLCLAFVHQARRLDEGLMSSTTISWASALRRRWIE